MMKYILVTSLSFLHVRTLLFPTKQKIIYYNLRIIRWSLLRLFFSRKTLQKETLSLQKTTMQSLENAFAHIQETEETPDQLQSAIDMWLVAHPYRAAELTATTTKVFALQSYNTITRTNAHEIFDILAEEHLLHTVERTKPLIHTLFRSDLFFLTQNIHSLVE